MITIQSAMFVALGFLAASLIWLLAAPSFWARAVRLTTARLRATMPLTEAEIRADKDRMRAEYALKLHQQQVELDEIKLSTARQLIELNRRDARINSLEADLEAVRASLEGALNARNVLEQTVVDRLPRLEERLNEAKEHLAARDDEIASLTRTAERQSRALQEASAINTQLKREVQTLTAALETAGAKAGTAGADGATDAVVAMRAELEALRTRSREQSALIDRLQKAIAETADSAPRAMAGAGALNGNRAVSLRQESPKAAESEKKLREARALAAAREQEIARLKAAIAAQEKIDKAGGESRIALKASLGAAEEKCRQQEATIQSLRTELAALQAQLTRQAAEHAEAVSRLGGGSRALSDTAGPSPLRERRAAPRLSLAERVAQSRRTAEDDDKENAEDGSLPSTPRPNGSASQADGPSSPSVNKSAGSPPGHEDSGPRRPHIRGRLLDRISNLSKA